MGRSSSMVAAVIERFGELTVWEVAKPEISEADDVVVQVKAAGVCRTDLETIDGDLAGVYGTPRFPYIPGHETAGIVESVGPAVRLVSPGDAVILHPVSPCGRCDACRSGRDMYCVDSTFAGVDAKTPGGWAEYVKVSERAVVPVGPASDLVALAPYTDAGLTAMHAVNRALPYLTPTTTAVVMGVGGVGHFGLQLIKLITGAKVIAVDPSPARAALAGELGADHVVSERGQEAVRAVREITSGGAGVVFDFVGSVESPDTGMAMLAKGGVFSVVGALGQLTVDTLPAVVNEYAILFNIVGNYSELKELSTLATRGMRSPVTTYRLAEAGKAVADLKSGSLEGRAVLVP